MSGLNRGERAAAGGRLMITTPCVSIVTCLFYGNVIFGRDSYLEVLLHARLY